MARYAAIIADSDGESDVDVQSQSSPRPDQGQTIPDVDLGVNFSDFLSQSQGYNMHDTQQSAPQEEQPEGAEKSTGATASLKRQIESEQRKLAEQRSSSSGRLSDIKKRPKSHSSDSPIVAKTKRRHSALENTDNGEGGRNSKRRREQTYGCSSSRLRSSQSNVFREDLSTQQEENMTDHSSSRNLRNLLDQPIDIGGPLTDEQVDITEGRQEQDDDYHDIIDEQSALHTESVIGPQQLGDSSVKPDFFKEYIQMSSGRMSTSRSLMGNHESINLHYSGNGPGVDVNANPFGDVLQQSVGDDDDRAERERLEAIFRPPQPGVGDIVAFPSNQDCDPHNFSHHHQHSGTEGAAILRDENLSRPASGRSKSFVDPSILTKNPPDDTQNLLGSKPSSSRKRRKTVDGFALDIESAAQEMDDLPITIATPELPPPKTERPGKKRGRKPKDHVSEPKDGMHQEQPEEGGDNDKTAFGNDGLAEGHPSSEPRLDDESAIGLPQEQYKPRPSRSRSKRGTDEGMPPPAHPPTKQTRTPKFGDTNQLDEQEDTPSTKLKKEKKRKNKMKRAKTSAAALLKKSDKMLSDGEEDVVWVESKPATVKMKLPDPVEVKREDSVSHERPTHEDLEAGGADISVAGREQSNEDASEESVEAVVEAHRPEEEQQKQPPKKRGRKPKTAVETPITTETEVGSNDNSNAAAEAQEEAEAEHEDRSNQSRSKTSSSRPALKEKDVNTSHATASRPVEEATSTPPKSNAAQATEPESPEKQQPPPTPQAQKNDKNENYDKNDRGPTKHSPINPTGGKVKYRVGLSRRAAIPPLLKIVRK